MDMADNTDHNSGAVNLYRIVKMAGFLCGAFGCCDSNGDKRRYCIGLSEASLPGVQVVHANPTLARKHCRGQSALLTGSQQLARLFIGELNTALFGGR